MAKTTRVVPSAAAMIAAAIVVDGQVRPFAVVCKREKWRGGRHWTAGVHAFETEEKLAELGSPEDVARMIETIAGDALDFDLEYAGKERPKTDQNEQPQG